MNNDVKTIPPFKGWVLENFPFIEADFDAITNYQLISKVIEYLNNVIDSENQQNIAIEDLYNKLIELRNYVDTIMPEEINNKLDEMAEDGTLANLLNNYAGLIKVYDTRDDLIADTTLSVGQKTKTLGYSSINDGNSGEYYITDVEGDNQETLDNGLYATLIKNSLVVSIDDYTGATAEEKLYKALDDIDFGVIICGYVEINNVYNASNKDYRNITILGGTLDIKIDYWFNQSGSLYNSVPLFKSCSIKGNDHIMYSNLSKCVGAMFNGCDIDKLCIFSNSNYFVQSLYIIGCTLNRVSNLITCNKVFDMKIANSRIESSSGKLIVITGDDSILQSTISGCLIEGRTDVVIEYVSAFKFVIRDNYFESNTKGLIKQNGNNKASFLTVDNNVFFGTLDVDYMLEFDTNTVAGQGKITNNLTNIAEGKLLCNKDLGVNPVRMITPTNTNYSHSWNNNGFALTRDKYNIISENSSDGTWDDDDNSWNYDIVMPYAEFYKWAHPFYVVFSGSYSAGSTQYQGYAILRVTPRVAYDSTLGVHNVCDCDVIDSCNKSSVVKASDVTATATLYSTSPGTTTQVISIKINGFVSTRGVFKVIDTFTLLDVVTHMQ